MSIIPMPLPWAQALIESANGPIPDYGSPEWVALPDDSRAKVAATVIAAEAWRTWWAPEEHARRLHAELDAARELQEPATWSADVVAGVHRTAKQPSYADLCDRRNEPERAERARAHRRRLGLPTPPRDEPEPLPDHRGGPVMFESGRRRHLQAVSDAG